MNSFSAFGNRTFKVIGNMDHLSFFKNPNLSLSVFNLKFCIKFVNLNLCITAKELENYKEMNIFEFKILLEKIGLLMYEKR